jgi:propionyl-CoA carboxylase alpha chain
MQHPRFRSGELTTGFIAEEYPDGFTGAPASEDLTRKLCAIAGFVAKRNSPIAPARLTASWAARLPRSAEWQVKIGVKHEVVVRDGKVQVDGEELSLSMEYVPGDRIVHAKVGGEAWR